MAICAVLLHLAHTFPPLPLLLPALQGRKLLCQQSILLLHLPQFKLPARASCGFEFVKDVVFRRECFILIANNECIRSCSCDKGIRIL
jgi:hypothetical protein